MLDALRSLTKKAKQLNENKLAREVLSVKSLQHDILDLNREDQLYEHGVGADGISLGDYSFVTRYHYKPLAAKEGRDGRIDHITLKDTGDFYRSFRFINERDGFHFVADALKEGGTDLTKIFGEEIIGLTDESKASVVDWIREPLREATRKALTS